MTSTSTRNRLPNAALNERSVSRAAEGVMALHPGLRAILGRVSLGAFARSLIGLAREIADEKALRLAVVERFADRVPSSQRQSLQELVDGVVLRIA